MTNEGEPIGQGRLVFFGFLVLDQSPSRLTSELWVIFKVQI